jgi:ribosomal-protein-alanine N-acetyltransferase
MTPADSDAVLDLERDVFGAEAWSRQMLAGELDQQPASRYYLVAEENGRLAGYAGLLGAGWQGDVLTLAVAAGRWGRGVGTALLRALLAEAARRGCTEVFLRYADNNRAQSCTAGRLHQIDQAGYYQPSGADALVMRRTLARESAWGSVGSPPRASTDPIHEVSGEQP